MSMRKMIFAAIAVAALAGNAFAVDTSKMGPVFVKLLIYHNNCAPLSPNLLSMATTMLKVMDETERARDMWEVSQAVAGRMGEFCKAMEPAVKQIENR